MYFNVLVVTIECELLLSCIIMHLNRDEVGLAKRNSCAIGYGACSFVLTHVLVHFILAPFCYEHGVGREYHHSPRSTRNHSHSPSQQSKFILNLRVLLGFILQLTLTNIFSTFHFRWSIMGMNYNGCPKHVIVVYRNLLDNLGLDNLLQLNNSKFGLKITKLQIF